MDLSYSEETRDLVLVNGDLDFCHDIVQLVMQRLFVKFKTFNRELFWDKNYGIDYLKNVFGRNKQIQTIDAIYKKEILEEKFVLELLDYQSQVKDYSYQASFKVRVDNRDGSVVNFYILQTEDGVNILDDSGNTLTGRIN